MSTREPTGRTTPSSVNPPSPRGEQQRTAPPEEPAEQLTNRTGTLNDRIISGIDLIDFGAGGLLPEEVYVVKGGVGTGKSILGFQFLSRGVELQEPGILITDQRPQKVFSQAKSIGFPLEEAARHDQLQVLNPSKRYFELVESPADVMAIIEEMSDYIRRVGARRLVIDPVYTLINTSYAPHFALSITQSLLNALEDLPVTTLLIAGDPEAPEHGPIIRMLEQNAYGVIELAPDQATGGRVMRLSKLRYASTENLAAHYRILDGRGLINYRGEGERVADVTKPWEESGMNRSVLLIGAGPETIRAAGEALGESYQLTAEADLRQGIERARTEKPGLVLITPSRSLQAVSAVLDLARDSSSSIAFLSPAANRASDKVLYLRAGADDFITEPFSPGEFRARVDALVRRSGRRLSVRGSSIPNISAEEISRLGDTERRASGRKGHEVLHVGDSRVELDPQFKDRLYRNIDTLSKLDMDFALYWIKSPNKDPELNRALARLCRQEDVLCHNASGEFVAILTGTDENGVRGFETRLQEKLGNLLSQPEVRRGHALYHPGDRPESLLEHLNVAT